ncbi:Elongation factor G, mitochondrial [Eumeta japonica]|uniref:Elongation factor G, mitochondrial n=1 Tax=Eumeta variegata TaxID=151549 RepID=A0A4C2AC02_EUMVA|nr:Elongation factor G, mitochondrial [Eumeta japonica]
MGELHLEIYAQRMEREYKCPVTLGKPKVAFRETLVSPCEFDYLHKKQSGGSGQYARVIGIMEPLPPHQNNLLEFKDETVVQMCQNNFIPGVERIQKCQREECYQVINYQNGNWQILEPIMLVEVTAPEEFQGAVIGQLNKRHGIITGTDGAEGWFTVYAEVPLNDMFGYAGELRSSTQGKGEYSMEYSRYSPCLPAVQEQIVRQYQESQGLLQGEKKKKKN